MPKLTNKNPKLGKLNSFAVVRYGGKVHYLKDAEGRNAKHGTKEAVAAYHRFCLELHTNPAFLIPKVSGDAKGITLDEVAAAYLEYAERRFDKREYNHYRRALGFAVEFYGDLPVDSFSYQNLRIVRTAMVDNRRLCRDMINKYIGRIRTALSWGVENGLVDPGTVAKLRVLRALPEGEPGTFDHDPREDVPADVVRITIKYAPPTVSAMIQIFGMTGLRPSELCKLTVGDIDRSDPDGWEYTLKKHKTSRKSGKKVIVFGKPEQELLAPYLIGKSPENAVFSPRTTEKERNAVRRANRKTKISPSQAERDRQRAENPKNRTGEFYNVRSFLSAVKSAITAAKRAGENVSDWTSYQLRHFAGTETSRVHGKDKAQALLTHKTSAMTARYDHSDVAVLKDLAKKRVNPFAQEK